MDIIKKRNVKAGILLIFLGLTCLLRVVLQGIGYGFWELKAMLAMNNLTLMFSISLCISGITMFINGRYAKGIGFIPLMGSMLVWFVQMNVSTLYTILWVWDCLFVVLLAVAAFVPKFPRPKLRSLYFIMPIISFLGYEIAAYLSIGAEAFIDGLASFSAMSSLVLIVRCIAYAVMGATLFEGPRVMALGVIGLLVSIVGFILGFVLEFLSLITGAFIVTEIILSILWFVVYGLLFFGLITQPFMIPLKNKPEIETAKIEAEPKTATAEQKKEA